MKALYGIIAFHFIWAFQLNGQNIQYEQKRYGQLDGLLSQRVHSIHQDSLGYLVLGTDNGIFLFDGHDFSRPPYHDQIESKRIEFIHPVGNNSYILLAGSPNTAYFIKNNQVSKVYALEGMRNVETVFAIDHKSKDIYFLKKKMMYRASLQEKENPVVLFKCPDDMIKFSIDSYGGAYIWDRFQRISYIVNGEREQQIQLSQNSRVWKFLNDQDSTTLVWSQDSILVLKRGVLMSKIHHKTSPQFVVRNVGHFSDGGVWFVEDGPELFEYHDGQVSRHYERLNLQERTITCAYQDHNNTYWIGTERNGLLRVRRSNTKLIAGSQGLKITTMAQAHGYFLIGTSDGIFQHYEGVLSRLNSGTDYSLGQQDVFEKNYTYQIAYQEGHWLIGSMRTQTEHTKTFEKTQILSKPAFVKNAPSTHLADNVLLGGSWGRFSSFMIHEGLPQNKVAYYGSLGRTNEFISLSKDLTLVVCDRRLLLAETNGTSLLDTTTLLGPNIRSVELTYNDIEIQGSEWYIATTEGVFKGTFNSENQRLEQIEQITYTESTCLLHLGKTLWMGGSNGLLQYTNGNVIPFLISTSYGDPEVLSIKFNESNSKLLVGTVNGLYQIDPFSQTLVDQQLKLGAPSLLLDGLVVQDNVKAVELGHDENTFEIQASVLNFLHPLKAEIMYSINGRTPEKGNSGLIRFNSLEANKYEIALWAEAANGQKTEKQLVHVQVLKPFWKTTWFLICIILFILSASATVLYARSRQLKNRARRERETQQLVNELEKKALNLSLNPHFLFNSLNSIQSRISTFKDEDLVNYIADFSSLMRKVLVNSDQSLIGLNEEMTQLELYIKMEQRRHPGKIDYQIKMSEQVCEQEFEIPPMLLQPFVENSILHGILPSSKSGLIRIEAFLKDSFLHLVIIDNGVGLKSNEHKQQHESKGLDITRKRVLFQHPQNTLSVADRDDPSNETGVRIEIKLWMGR